MTIRQYVPRSRSPTRMFSEFGPFEWLHPMLVLVHLVAEDRGKWNKETRDLAAAICRPQDDGRAFEASLWLIQSDRRLRTGIILLASYATNWKQPCLGSPRTSRIPIETLLRPRLSKIGPSNRFGLHGSFQPNIFLDLQSDGFLVMIANIQKCWRRACLSWLAK